MSSTNFRKQGSPCPSRKYTTSVYSLVRTTNSVVRCLVSVQHISQVIALLAGAIVNLACEFIAGQGLWVTTLRDLFRLKR